jgi:hypothetical protein
MRLPNESQSVLILGKNGSGKSRAAVWHLAQKDLQNFPWIVINHKNEELIDSIPGAQMVDMKFTPKKPGLYVYHPIPEADDDAVTSLLWRIYKKENVGVYIDEGYMINPRDPALTALYTQGRSKHIPLITLSQRPSKISRFAVSEAAFLQVFYLVDKRDRETVNAFIPYSLENLMRTVPGEDRLLPEFHSVYYDVGKNDLAIMAPVPDDVAILSLFENKLKTNRKGLFNL